MKILFDGQIFIGQHSGGISRYFTHLAASLDNLENVNASIISPFHRNSHLNDQTSTPVRGFYLKHNWRVGRICWASLRLLSPLISKLNDPDIVHETYFSEKPYLTKTKKRVITVYDMIHELYFPGSETSKVKLNAINRADHIICISHNTKKDLCDILNIPASKISVTHLAYKDFSNYQPKKDKTSQNKPYFLFVGNRDFYKNFNGMLTAYGSSEILKKESKIACFGGGPLKKEEIIFAEKKGICRSKIVHLGSNDHDLGKAYANAIALVYPSQYEGFGIPPLEAMSADCPVLCSNNSSLPEVVGSAALTFDPLNHDEIRYRMEQMVSSKSLAGILRKKGHEQRNKFSWESCAQETRKIYQKII